MTKGAYETHKVNPEITPRMNTGALQHLFVGKGFMHVIIELIKNSRDYGATEIDISFPSRGEIIITDNGQGMSAANREAFACIGVTTSDKRTQHGRFGTGTTYMFYSFCTHVQVQTVAEESSEWVHEFGFTTGEYEEMVFQRKRFRPNVKKKTAQTWSHASSTGTCIRYTLRDPKSQSILRGDALAKDLAARLPLKFLEIVTVNGQPLPEKEVIGSVFSRTVTRPGIGEVTLELYRPKRRSRDDSLRIGGIEMGEVPMKSLCDVVGEQSDRIPNVFKNPEVCGTIIAPTLHGKYINDDRTSFNASLVDEPTLATFFRILASLEAEAQEALELMEDSSQVDAAQEVQRHIVDRLAGVYGTERDGPNDEEVTPPKKPGGSKGGKGPSVQIPIMLKLNRREFEPGEEIDLQARLSPDLVRKKRKINWNLRRAGEVGVVLKEETRYVLRAGSTLGVFRVTADVPGTTHSHTATFEVVSERTFRLSPASATIKPNQEQLITCVNADKLSGGAPTWRTTDFGTFTERGETATFVSARPGRALIQAYDAERPSRQASCQIIVTAQDQLTVRIRDQVFRVKVEAGGRHNKPVLILEGGEVHNMIVCTSAPGVEEALATGGETGRMIYLWYAIARAYASFSKLVLEGAQALVASDLPEIADETEILACQVFAEIMKKEEESKKK